MHEHRCERCGVSCPEEYMQECAGCPRIICPMCAEGSEMCAPCESRDRLALAA
jgi:hypothetical protein